MGLYAVDEAGFGESEHAFPDEAEWNGGALDVFFLECVERGGVAFCFDLCDLCHDVVDTFRHFVHVYDKGALVGAVACGGVRVEGECAVFEHHADLDGGEL